MWLELFEVFRPPSVYYYSNSVAWLVIPGSRKYVSLFCCPQLLLRCPPRFVDECEVPVVRVEFCGKFLYAVVCRECSCVFVYDGLVDELLVRRLAID